MAEMEEATTAPVTPPQIVEYDPLTGVPSEFNEYLPKDCDEFKRWKAAAAGPEALAALTLKDKEKETQKQLPGGKVKKKAPPQIVLEMNTRNKKKAITIVSGLDSFKVNLKEASKVFGKKFATGASVCKTASGGEQVEMQGDFVDQLAELIIAKYGESNAIPKASIWVVADKKKVPYYDDEDDEDDEEDEEGAA